MDLQAVIFDLDDTLVYGFDPACGRPLDLHFESWRALLGPQRVDLGHAEYVAHMKGHTNDACEAYVARAHGVALESNPARSKERYYRGFLVPRYLHFRDGAPAFLRKLVDAGLRVGVLTNAPEGNVQAANERLALFDLVARDHIVNEPDLQAMGMAQKPAPDGLHLLAERLAFDVAGAIYVGDSRADLQAGSGAGICTIAIEANYSRAELLSLGATDTFQAFTELSIDRLRDTLRQFHISRGQNELSEG